MKAVPTDSGVVAAALLLLAPRVLAAPSPHPVRRDPPAGIVNGDFETGQLSPWVAEAQDPDGEYPTPATIVSPGFNSNYAVSIKPITEYETNEGDIIQRVYADFNTNYLISAQYKVTDGPADGSCNVTMTADDGWDYRNVVETKMPMTVGDWATISVQWGNFAPPNGYTWFDFYLGVECASGEVLFDAVTLKSTGTLQPDSCPGSAAVPNGDFESGELAPWTLKLSGDESPQAETVLSPGDNSDHAFAFSFPAGTTFAGGGITQTVDNICFNYQYNVEFDINWVNYGPVSSPNNSNACEMVAGALNCGDWLDKNEIFIYPADEGWAHYSIPCTATRDKIYLEFDLGCGSGGPTGDWSAQVDNVQINYVGGPAPAPSSNERRMVDVKPRRE